MFGGDDVTAVDSQSAAKLLLAGGFERFIISVSTTDTNGFWLLAGTQTIRLPYDVQAGALTRSTKPSFSRKYSTSASCFPTLLLISTED